MPLTFSIFEVLVLIGITQGFVVATILLVKKRKYLDKLLLALVLVVFNLLCCKILIHTTGLWQTRWFRYFPLPFEMAIQPLLYLYIAALTKIHFRLGKGHLIHFIPFFISFGYSIFIYDQVFAEIFFVEKDAIANNFYFNQIKQIEDFLSVGSSLVYWLAGLVLIIRYRLWLYNNISDTDYPTYTWLRNIALLMGFLILGLSTAIFLDYFIQFNTMHFFHWQLFFGYLAILIYYLGLKGSQVAGKRSASSDHMIEFTGAISTSRKTIGEEGAISVISPKLPEDKLELVKIALLQALEKEELYLDPELNLAKLAAALNQSPTVVSVVINQGFHKSFRNLINDYRIEKVKKRLIDPASQQYSILGIAYECGFHSEASFYRIFKATVGVSPKEFVQQGNFKK